MKITPSGSVPTRRAPASYFTGTVWQDPVIEAPQPARLNAARVTFEPGARTAWHTHPLGQTPVCACWVWPHPGRRRPCARDSRRRCRVDSAGEKHWHGAAPTTMMAHLAMQESENGSAATWLEHVTDAQYNEPVSG